MKQLVSGHGGLLSPLKKTLCWTARHKSQIAFTAIIMSCGVTANHAHAEIPEMAVFANAQVVPDQVLGETRGKFISNGQVMNFGVEMVTQWITSTGEVINAAGRLTIDVSGAQPRASFVPNITVQQTTPQNIVVSPGNNFVSGSEGLNNVTGVVQTIQAAGNANGIGNSIGVKIRRSDNAATPSPGGSSVNSLGMNTASGSSANVSLANNGMSVGVNVANQGQSMQAIRSVAQGSGQVMQSVRLGGDFNQINNLINLDIQLRNSAVNNNLDSRHILSSMRNLSDVGGL